MILAYVVLAVLWLSLIAYALLGASAAAVASGHIHIQGANVQADLGATWLTPFALIIGAMAVSLCASLAAVYLAVEAQQVGDVQLVKAFRLRAIIAGAVTAVF